MKIFPLGFFFCHDFFYVDQEHVFSQLIELLPAEFGHGLVLGDIGLGQGFFAVVARLRKIHRQLGLKLLGGRAELHPFVLKLKQIQERGEDSKAQSS